MITNSRNSQKTTSASLRQYRVHPTLHKNEIKFSKTTAFNGEIYSKKARVSDK